MILTDSVSSLTIFSNQNVVQHKRRQLRSERLFLGTTNPLRPYYLRSNMGDLNEIILTFTNNQIQLMEMNNSSSQFRDGNIWIEKYPGSPKSENLVALRKINSITYICMDQYGNIFTQELQSLSNPECIWSMKKSAFGVEFYNFHHPQSHHEHWYLGTCFSKPHFLCRIINEQQNHEMSPYWFIFRTDSHQSAQLSLPQPLPWNPIELYQSIKQSINRESHLFCDQIVRNLTTIALFDIKESFNVIRKFTIGINYLRWFLLSKSFSVKHIDTIMNLTKSIVIFYGYKKRKKLFRYFECSINHFKYCTTFRNKQKKSISHRHFISKANQQLIQLLIPSVRMNYGDKLKWLKHPNSIEFIQKVIRVNIPKKNQIVMAAYFLQNYLEGIDIFNDSDQQWNKIESYYENIFVKKFEEIFYGLTLSMKSENIEKLKNIRRKFSLLGTENVCYLSTVEKLIRNAK